MSRPSFRQSPAIENLETRQVMSAGGPSADTQYLLELVNEARTNPAAAAERVTTNLDPDTEATLQYYRVDADRERDAIASVQAKPPLAWSDQLASAAQWQSQDQANTGSQSHTGSDGSTLDQRLERTGYRDRAAVSENAFAYAQSVEQAHQAFLVDWGVSDKGHRKNLLQPDAPADQTFTEIGIGVVKTNRKGIGPVVVTQNLARQKNARPQLLGVAFSDDDGDDFYTPGEGQGGVKVTATNLANGASSGTETWEAGGYQLPLDPGPYRVTAKLGNQVVKSQDVQIGSNNVKVDVRLDDVSPETPAPAPAPAPTPVPALAVTPRFVATRSYSPTTNVINITSVPARSKGGNANFNPLGWITNWNSWKANSSRKG